jgi:hypothetical protein
MRVTLQPEHFETWKQHISDGQEYRWYVDRLGFNWVQQKDPEAIDEQDHLLLDYWELLPQFGNVEDDLQAFVGELGTLLNKPVAAIMEALT